MRRPSARPALRRLAAVSATACLVVSGVVGGAGSAAAAASAAAAGSAAAGHDGYCTDSSGVTVVVDFQQLGGGVVIRCAPTPLPGSGTGLSALQAAGVPYEGVRRWGDSFICRLYGKPSASQGLAVTGHPDYHEACIDTPPSTAYWSYWSATNGGAWTYSQAGVKNRRALAGGFEGWSFSLNGSTSGSPAPRVAPTRPAAPVVNHPKPSPSHSTRHTVPSTSPGRSTSGATTPGSAATRTPAGTSTSGSTTMTGPPTTTTGTPTPTTGSPPTSAGLVADSTALAAGATASPAGGPSTTTLLGAGLLAFLAVAGAGTAWRRRRE